MAYAMKHQGQVSTASGLDVIAGIWILISPFVLAFHGHTGAITNNVVLGIVIGILALIRSFSRVGTVWISWLNCLLGVWMLISPWCVGFSAFHAATTNNVVMGIIVIILSAWSAIAGSNDTTTPGYDRTVQP